MDSSTIITNLNNFFTTASKSKEVLKEVNDAFLTEIDGDISLDEYISYFQTLNDFE